MRPARALLCSGASEHTYNDTQRENELMGSVLWATDLDIFAARPGCTVKEIPSTFAQRRSGRTKRDLRAFAVSYVGTLRRLHALKREVERGR